MGLASKLAATNAGGAPYGGQGAYPPQQQYPPQGGVPPKTGGYPGQQQYQAYAPGAPQGFPPQGQAQGGYGQQQGYGGGAPPLQQGAPIQAYKNKLNQAIQENGLQTFFPPNSQVIDQLAQKASQQIPGLAQRWRIPMEIANDLVQLGLYDTTIFIDDSGSMQFEENGERIKDLQLILERVTSVSTIFDDDGISLRFMNANYQPQLLENIKSEQQVQQLMSSVQYKGLTPMGTELRKKVLEGIIFPKIRARQLTKPQLVIVITDGTPAGEAPGAVFDTIKLASTESTRTFGSRTNAITFQFAQVGNDLKARDFLAKLDEDASIGQIVDCTSNYENESDEMRKMGQDLTPEMWLVKLLLGAIDSSYDSKDEAPVAGRPPPGQYGAPPPGQYGAPPPGQYGAPPPGQYGAPPPGGYAPPPGAPPSGGPQYGGQGGYPPQQQQGYGRGYPPQGGQRY